MSKQTPDYGLDAPPAVYAMFVLGLAAAIFGFVIVWTSSRHVSLAYAVQIFGVICLILALSCSPAVASVNFARAIASSSV